MKKEKLYRCVGENYMPNFCDLGFCGDVHTLKEWIEILFPDKVETVLELYDRHTDSALVDYIFLRRGKRLTKER